MIMKSNYLITLTITFLFLSVISNAAMAPLSDSVVLGPGYVNEAYYKFSSGVVKTAPRATWDIAFRTKKLSSSIIINDGAEVILFTYPKADTSGWNTMDTVGLSSWQKLYNDPSDWENGAFSRNASGHPDYGWGIYNMATHNLTGDSLYVIKLRNGSLKKLWIMSKKSAANIYNFKYANMDGSDLKTVELNLNPHVSMDFYGYSLQTNEGVAFQPAQSDWDIVYTRYMSVQPNGTPYPVVGVLSKDTVSTKKFHPVTLDYSDFGAGSWDSTRSSIGWDWKYFDMNSFTFQVEDSTVYFVKPVNGDIYKLVYKSFTGSASGIARFDVVKAAGAGIFTKPVTEQMLNVWPNPVRDIVQIEIPENYINTITISLTDLKGRQLRADRMTVKGNGPSVYSMDVTGVQAGMYLVTVSNAASSSAARLIIKR